MSVALIGNGGIVADVDEARNLLVSTIAPQGYPAAGGFFTVAGKSGTAAIAASLATDTPLATARFSATSTRKAYITKVRVEMAIITAGAAAGVPGVLGLQKFNTATPSGGSARTPTRLGPTKGSATDMTDVRDSNAALTVTSVVFTDEIGWTVCPNGSTNVVPTEWVFEPETPLELAAGDGIALRTRQAGPATATWFFVYTIHWYER